MQSLWSRKMVKKRNLKYYTFSFTFPIYKKSRIIPNSWSLTQPPPLTDKRILQDHVSNSEWKGQAYTWNNSSSSSSFPPVFEEQGKALARWGKMTGEGRVFCKSGYFSSLSPQIFTEDGLFWETVLGSLKRKSLILGWLICPLVPKRGLRENTSQGDSTKVHLNTSFWN